MINANDITLKRSRLAKVWFSTNAWITIIELIDASGRKLSWVFLLNLVISHSFTYLSSLQWINQDHPRYSDMRYHTAALISFKKRICLMSYSSGSNHAAVCMARFSILVQTVNCCWLEIVFFLNSGGSSSNGSNPLDAQYSSCSSCCLTESSAKAIRCSLMNLASALEYCLPREESYIYA